MENKTWMEQLAELMQKKHVPVAEHAAENKTAFDEIEALEKGPQESSGTAKTPNMATGGQVPPLGQVMTSLNQTPNTNYDFYKDISADDRAKLYQQLQQKKQGAGQGIISGVAGLGDAIANSFGGQHNQFQQNVGQQAQINMDSQLGNMDTQRTQRMQDMSGNQEMLMNDPNHPMAQSMRETLKAAGLNVPSGMNANLMLKIAGPLGELAMKQATQQIQMGQAAEAKRHNQVEEGLTGVGQAQAAAKQQADLADKAEQQKFDAAKAVNSRPWYQKAAEMIPGMKSDATQIMQNQMTGAAATSPSPVAFDTDKEARYQAWKASQGK